jgi:importin-7
LKTFVGTALAHLDTAETSALRLANLEVLINAVLYNPAAALKLMESFRAGSARLFFDKWFAAIHSADSRLPRVHDKKLSILALCALLELAPVDIPEGLHEGWPGIISGALKLFQDLPKAIEGTPLSRCACITELTTSSPARKALEEAFEEDDDDDSEGHMFNLNDDDGK